MKCTPDLHSRSPGPGKRNDGETDPSRLRACETVAPANVHRDTMARTLAHGFGLAAEIWVALRFRLKGHRILAHRFRSSGGEIDLIARRGRRLSFIEVKARRSAAIPQDLVPRSAARRIRAAADDFVARHARLGDCELRFVLVVTDGARLSIYEDAL